MAKIIVWLVVIVVVMLALRIVNVRNARRRAQEQQARQPAAAKGGEPMVRCIRCGTYLPQIEARSVRGGYACSAGECAAHA